jgi:hypothetical protein
MFFGIVLLPIVVVIIAIVFGYCVSALRFVLSLVLYAGLLVAGVFALGAPTLLWGLALALFVFGIPFLAALSIKTKKVIDPALADHAKTALHTGYASYEALDESKKKKVHRGIKILAKLGMAYVSDRLKNSGHDAEATLLRRGSKLL